MALGDKLPVVMGKEKAVANGVATLGTDGKLAEEQRPSAEDIGGVTAPALPGVEGQLFGVGANGLTEWITQDAEPTENSTNPVQSGGVYTALAGKADTTLSNLSNYQKALHNIGGRPNRNLLVNWYFGNPVNQRGQTVYNSAGGGYCICGWYRGYTADAILTVQDGYIEFVGADNAELMQRLEELYLGETVTASVLLQDGTLAAATGTLPSAYSGGYLDAGIGQSIPNTGGAYLGLSYYDNRLRFNFVCPSGSSLKPVAAKLELGSRQTLAYKNESGALRLYEIPVYAEELLKCQYYYVKDAVQVITNSDSAAVIQLPRKMRVNPTCTVDVGTFSSATLSTIFVNGISANTGAIINYTASAEL